MNKTQLRTKYIQNMKALEFPKTNMLSFYVTNVYNKKYYKSRCVDDLTYQLEVCQRDFNENVLKVIRKQPINFLRSYPDSSLEHKIEVILGKLPAEDIITKPYWDKYYKAIIECTKYVTLRLKGEKSV